MITTQIANTIGKYDIGYVLVALLSESSTHQILELLKELNDELNASIWVMPAEALHITLCEIIQPKEYTTDKLRLYAQHSDEYERITSEILEKFGPIHVSFDTIEASPQAIIVSGTDDGSFEEIRKELVDKLPLPRETKMPPNIIHTSIARYVKELPLTDIVAATGRHTVVFNEEVKEFRLVKNLQPPLLKYETIRTFPLL